MSGDHLPPNFRWLEEGQIAGSGLPETAQHVDALHAAGVRAVVSFHPLPDSVRQRLQERGMEHLAFPVTGLTEPLAETLETLFEFVDERAFPASGAPQPVLFH